MSLAEGDRVSVVLCEPPAIGYEILQLWISPIVGRRAILGGLFWKCQALKGPWKPASSPLRPCSTLLSALNG